MLKVASLTDPVLLYWNRKFSRDLLKFFESCSVTLEFFLEGSRAPLTLENFLDNKNRVTDGEQSAALDAISRSKKAVVHVLRSQFRQTCL